MVKFTVRNSEVGTRGSKRALLRDLTTVRVFEKYGAKLVDAHGNVTGEKDEVPPGCVVVFLSEIGLCASVSVLRHFANDYFRSKSGIKAFLEGAASRQGRHHGNAHERTYLSGEKYPRTELQFWDANYAGMGYVYKLPLHYERRLEPPEYGPTKGEIYPEIQHNSSLKTLDEVMRKLGSGVYIIASCLVSKNQASRSVYPAPRPLPMSFPRAITKSAYWLPERGWKGVAAARTRGTISLGIHRSVGQNIKRRVTHPHRPGTPRRTHVPYFKNVPLKRRFKIRVDEVLRRMSRNANTVNLNKLIPQMNATVNVNKLRRTLYYLKNPDEFFATRNANNKLKFNNTPRLNKAAFIHSLL